MKSYKGIFAVWLLIQSCNYQLKTKSLPMNLNDTIINKEANRVIVRHQSSSVDSVFIKQVTTTLLRDSLTEQETNLLRGARNSDLCYVDGNDSTVTEIKTFSRQKEDLVVKIYFSRGPGDFYLGKARLNSFNELVLGFGNKITVDGYGFPIPYYSMELVIQVPTSITVNKVVFDSEF